MTFDWFKVCSIFDLSEDAEQQLVSKTYDLNLEGYGQYSILVTRGVGVGVVFDDVFLLVQLNEDNPFVFEDRAVYYDEDSNIWVGFKNED